MSDICRLFLCLIWLGAFSPIAHAQNAPDAPALSDIASHALTATAPALPAGAVFLTLQKRAAWDYYAPFADVATNLSGGAVTSVSSLDAGTYYAFRYLAVNDDGAMPGYETQVQTLAEAPIAPGAPSFANVQATSLEVPLPSFPDNAYQLVLQQKQPGESSFSDVAQFYGGYYGGQNASVYYLQPETTYLFRWVAMGQGGAAAGQIASVMTAPAPPQWPDVPSFSNITATTALAHLPALPIGATSLRLEKRSGDDWYNPVYTTVAVNLAANALVPVTGLTPATYYQFRAVAVGPGGETLGYDAYFQTLPPAPNAPAAPSFENVQATSLEVPLPTFPANAEQLKLQQKPLDGGAWSDVAQFDSWYSGYGQRAYVYNLQAETAYLFRWVAVGQGGATAGEANDIVTAPAPPQTPNSPSFTNITAHGASATMPALPSGATTLRLEKRSGGDWYNPTYETVAANLSGGATVPLTGLNAASYYQYRVVAIGVGGETPGSDGYLYTAYEAPATPPAPSFTNVQATQLDVPVPSVANANNLRLQRKGAGEPDGNYYDVAQVNLAYNAPTSVTAYYLTPGTAYTFRWIASSNGGESTGPSANVITLTDGDPNPTPTPTPSGDPTPTPTPGVTPTPTPTVAPTPTPVPQPHPVDVTIAAGDDENPTFAGENVYNQTGTNQTQSQSVVPNSAAVYTVQVQNETAAPAAFTVTAPGDELGWAVRYYALPDANAPAGDDPPAEDDPDAPPGPDITGAVTGEGWTTPLLDPGARCTIIVQVRLTTTDLPDGASKPLLIQASPGAGPADAVQAVTVRKQHVLGMQYSRDNGATWTNVPDTPLEVEEGDVIGFKVLLASGAEPVIVPGQFKPEWTQGTQKHSGNIVWLDFALPAAGHETETQRVSVEWGDSAFVDVRAVPEAE